jgi:hypothetical protein
MGPDSPASTRMWQEFDGFVSDNVAQRASRDRCAVKRYYW